MNFNDYISYRDTGAQIVEAVRDATDIPKHGLRRVAHGAGQAARWISGSTIADSRRTELQLFLKIDNMYGFGATAAAGGDDALRQAIGSGGSRATRGAPQQLPEPAASLYAVVQSMMSSQGTKAGADYKGTRLEVGVREFNTLFQAMRNNNGPAAATFQNWENSGQPATLQDFIIDFGRQFNGTQYKVFIDGNLKKDLLRYMADKDQDHENTRAQRTQGMRGVASQIVNANQLSAQALRWLLSNIVPGTQVTGLQAIQDELLRRLVAAQGANAQITALPAGSNEANAVQALNELSGALPPLP